MRGVAIAGGVALAVAACGSSAKRLPASASPVQVVTAWLEASHDGNRSLMDFYFPGSGTAVGSAVSWHCRPRAVGASSATVSCDVRAKNWDGGRDTKSWPGWSFDLRRNPTRGWLISNNGYG
jgi:hypothetical protein